MSDPLRPVVFRIGKPCARDGTTIRYISSGECRECKSEYRVSREKRPENEIENYYNDPRFFQRCEMCGKESRGVTCQKCMDAA